jgi:hypothetical protein
MIRVMADRFDRFWFAPIAPYSVALLRFALLTFLVYVRLPEEVGLLLYRNGWPAEFMAPGVGLRWSPLPFPFPVESIELFHTGLVFTGACAAIGLLTRPSLMLFTIGYVYLKGVESAWGSFDHEPTIVVQILALLVVVPGTTTYSADRVLSALLRRNRKRHSLYSVVAGPAVPRWGLQLILVVVVIGYFGAGVSKLRHGGVEWLSGKTLVFYMSGKSHSSKIQQYGSAQDVADERKWKDGFGLEFYLLGARAAPLAPFMDRHPFSYAIAALGALSLELLSPLILLGGWFRVLLLLGAAVMHVCIDHLMGITFLNWIVIDLALVDWPWIARAVFAAFRRWAGVGGQGEAVGFSSDPASTGRTFKSHEST